MQDSRHLGREGEEGVTGINALIERLHNHRRYIYANSGDTPIGRDLLEAADALEELQKELAEDKQRWRGHFCVQAVSPELEASNIWKAKYEAEKRLYSAAREKLQREIAEEKRKREEAEVHTCETLFHTIKALEAKFEAAREIAIFLAEGQSIGMPDSRQIELYGPEIDAEIEAKMKQKTNENTRRD